VARRDVYMLNWTRELYDTMDVVSFGEEEQAGPDTLWLPSGAGLPLPPPAPADPRRPQRGEDGAGRRRPLEEGAGPLPVGALGADDGTAEEYAENLEHSDVADVDEMLARARRLGS